MYFDNELPAVAMASTDLRGEVYLWCEYCEALDSGGGNKNNRGSTELVTFNFTAANLIHSCTLEQKEINSSS